VIVWLLPNWIKYHLMFIKSRALTALVMTTIRIHQEQISGGFVRFENPKVREFTVSLVDQDICTLRITRMKKPSPTFPEYFKLVEKSSLDARLMIRCNHHQDQGREECAARVFEWENPTLSILDNTKMRKQILEPMLSAMKKTKIPQNERNQAVLELFFAGLRINEIMNLKTKDVDFTHNLVLVHQPPERKNINHL